MRERPDLVLTDVMMPVLNGLEVCREIKSNPATRLTPVMLVSGVGDTDDRIKGINAGADDFLSKPFHIADLSARVRSLVRLKRYTDDLDSAAAVITSLALAIEARDPYTEGHCLRLASYATALGAQLNLPEPDMAALFRGGFLHDIGKVGIPDAILRKPSSLTAGEFEAMKLHTVIGDRLCGELRSLRPVRAIVRHHHERLDGSGYPDGLKGDTISLLAHIMSIVDVFDALTTDRPYRRATTPEDAFEVLRAEAAKGWRRSDLVEEFIVLGHREDFHRQSSDQAGASPQAESRQAS
jgi:putative two-component system response regulator